MTSFFDLGAFSGVFSKSDDERQEIVNMARTAEAAERYEDMCEFMKHLVNDFLDGRSLTVEERNLLSVAYKNVIGSCRAAWRTLQAESQSDANTGAQKQVMENYNKLVETELVDTCTEVLVILDTLIAGVGEDDVEASVFYLKMAGDYYRYLAESVSDEPSYSIKAGEYYERAYEKATVGSNALVPTHPIRLGLALNYSVCHYEILKNKKEACELAKQAFDDAIAKLDRLEESDYKDSTLIMQLLRDNLTLWSASEEDLGADSQVQVEDFSDDEN